MVLIPTAASPHARPWTMVHTRPATFRAAGYSGELHRLEAEATTTTSAPTTTTTSAPPTTTTTAAAPSPPPTTFAPPPTSPAGTSLPARGHATASGCDAALSYLRAYAAPGFTLQCPGYAEGHQGMTCVSEPGICTNSRVIAIADACPQTYMNEASNSWVLTGQSDAPIDPYGACP